MPILFGEIIIPEAVFKELEAAGIQSFIESLLKAPWLNTVSVNDLALTRQLNISVDLGESEALALATELNAHFLLIDERRGRQLAAGLGIRVIGLLGILILAKEKGLVFSVKPWLERLISETAFRQSPQLVAKVLALAGEE